MGYAPLSASAVCPFYNDDQDSPHPQLGCEGFYGRSIKIFFHNKVEKSRHAAKFCASENCKKCEIYKLNMKKYEEGI